jgi:16S rRNA (guanine1516-N2)-methyltransferase
MTRAVRLALTTTFHAPAADAASAREAAQRHSLPFLPRGRRSLDEIASAAGAEALVVVGAGRVSLFLDGEERRWDPGMGVLRARRLASGDGRTRDTFLDAAGLRAGEEVLDATLGLAADALVAAAAVGPAGRVLGVESSPALALLAELGLPRLARAGGGLPAAARVEVRCCDVASLLPTLPDRSFDLVVFDPMFRHPRAEPAGFDLVRRLGDPRPLSPETLAEARRVARRAVLVKDGTPGWDLARLGLTPLPSARGAHRLYGRIETH